MDALVGAHHDGDARRDVCVEARERACPVGVLAEEANATLKRLVSEAEVAMNKSAERLAELETMIADAESNRTDENTTIDDVLARYPQMAAEIKQEIKDHNWY